MNWISVEDRLPSAEGLYLVCFEDDCGNLRRYFTRWMAHSSRKEDRKLNWLTKGIINRKNIKYWMPLPEKPNPNSSK